MANYKLGIKVSVVTIIINVVLSIIKILAGIIGNSSAILADGIHTLSDVLTSIIVIIGLKVSSKDADKRHPYGHEKFELIFAKILSIILAATGIFIGYKGIKILISGNIQVPARIALVAAVASIITKEVMYRYTIRAADKIKSVSMRADAWHHRSDVFSSIGTFIGVLGARLGFEILDPIAGIIVSILIIKVGLDLYIESIGGLVDEAADEETISKIRKLTMDVEGVLGIKTLKTRTFGNKIYVDIDILVDKDITVKKGHKIAEHVHDIVEERIEEVKHCMIHVEPKL